MARFDFSYVDKVSLRFSDPGVQLTRCAAACLANVQQVGLLLGAGLRDPTVTRLACRSCINGAWITYAMHQRQPANCVPP